MPQRSQFDLNAPSLVPLLPTIGVLENASEKSAIIGAYYDSEEEFKGLYLITAEDGVNYFDIPLEDIFIDGLSQFLFFAYEGLDYTVRPLVEDDGIWVSNLKTPLPYLVLSKMIVTESTDTIKEIVNVDIGDSLPLFEALFAYYNESLDLVVSLVYMSNFGTYARVDGDWSEDDISAPSYQDLFTVEIGPNKADEFIDLFDKKLGNVSLSETTPYAISEIQEEEGGEQ
jgi:hypothetical protein